MLINREERLESHLNTFGIVGLKSKIRNFKSSTLSFAPNSVASYKSSSRRICLNFESISFVLASESERKFETVPIRESTQIGRESINSTSANVKINHVDVAMLSTTRNSLQLCVYVNSCAVMKFKAGIFFTKKAEII